MPKLKKIFIIVPIVLILIGLYLFLALVVFEDDMRPPKLPIESAANTLSITSNGCCFWVEDVVISLLNTNGQRTELGSHEAVYMHNIFKHTMPTITDSPLSLLVEFKCFYGDEVDFSMSVMDFTDINEIKQTGVLIYFQEHDDVYLNVVAGKNHKSYKMGSEENRWLLMDIPNSIYSN
ncbi:MAG: hypothetical protein FWG36_09205 [Oscillospiraceae bacterium]|nr:hypothetical protein [Oscillospiraceae bacterium]